MTMVGFNIKSSYVIACNNLLFLSWCYFAYRGFILCTVCVQHGCVLRSYVYLKVKVILLHIWSEQCAASSKNRYTIDYNVKYTKHLATFKLPVVFKDIFEFK